jgi:hypothetical protein
MPVTGVSLRERSVIRDPTFWTGVQENTSNIVVIMYAQVTSAIVAQLAQNTIDVSCFVPSNMCLIWSRMLSFAA